MRKTNKFRKPTKLRKTQRGSAFRIPIVDDLWMKTYSSINKPQQDKELGRLSIREKINNLRELLSEINIRNGQYIRGILKSKSPILTHIGKRLVVNRYNDEWFTKNFIEPRTGDSQLDDYKSEDGLCEFLSTYLKELYIIITEDTDKFKRGTMFNNRARYFTCDEVFPELSNISEKHKVILNNIFGKDVMGLFIENYYSVKTSFENIFRQGILSKQQEIAVKEGIAKQPIIQDQAVLNTHKKLPNELQDLIMTNLKDPQRNETRQKLEKLENERIERIENKLMGEEDRLTQAREEETKENTVKEENTEERKENPAGGSRKKQKGTRNKRNKSNKK